MSYYKKESNVPKIIICVTVALVTLGLVAAIVVGVIRSKQTNDPIDSIQSNEITESSGTDSDVTKPNTDVPVITPGTEQGGEEIESPEKTTDQGHVSVDIIDANKENEKENTPHIVGDVSVLPGVKGD